MGSGLFPGIATPPRRVANFTTLATATLMADSDAHGARETDHSRRCALIQRRSARRMGENDAWLVATAEDLNADVVGADRAAFDRLGERYLRFR